MHNFIKGFVVVALLALVQTGAVNAQSRSTSLSAAAARDGYSVAWLLPERAVRLYKPGLIIVLRPGATMYEVNDRVEFADAAPQYANGDLIISGSLAARLARLSSYAAVPRQGAVQGMRSMPAPVAAAGPITLDVQPQAGSEAINVSGRAPSSAPVMITLLATISRDLPSVVVSRQEVLPDSAGAFQAVISTGPDYLRDTFLRVLATSAGATPASKTIVLGAPNAGVTVPFDTWPQDICPNGCHTSR